jgi:hypothetical protein
LFKFFLEQRQRTPRELCAVRYAVCVEAAALGEVAHDAVGVIHRLAACVVERLAGVMFLVAEVGDFRDGCERIGEVVEQPRSHRDALARVAANR